jgi:hypothetical protein
MSTPNMPAEEWPDLTAEELSQVGETLQGVQAMRDAEQKPDPIQ